MSVWQALWQAILDPLTRIVEVMDQNWTRMLGTLFVLVLGWLVAKLIRMMLVRGMRVIKLDVVADKAGIDAFLKKGGIQHDSVGMLGALVYWIGIIVVLVMVLRIWEIDIGLSDTLVPFLPKIFVSLVILILGLYLAAFVGDMVRTAAANAEMTYSRMLGQTIRWILAVFVILTALTQLGVETQLISWGFLLILGSLCLGFALALGLGAKEVVGKRLERWVSQIEEEHKKAHKE